MIEMEIFFDDLKEETQKRVLDFYNLTRPEDGNYDVHPLCVLNYEKDQDED